VIDVIKPSGGQLCRDYSYRKLLKYGHHSSSYNR